VAQVVRQIFGHSLLDYSIVRLCAAGASVIKVDPTLVGAIYATAVAGAYLNDFLGVVRSWTRTLF